MNEETYNIVCHVDGCEEQFLAVTDGEYVEHLLSEHGSQTGGAVAEMVIDELGRKERSIHSDSDGDTNNA